MSAGRRASLDGSLLARKGDASPAIPDESPLILRLDTRWPEPVEMTPTAIDHRTPEQYDDGGQSEAGGRSEDGDAAGRWGSAASPRNIALAAVGVAAMLLVGFFVFANPSSEAPQSRVESTPLSGADAETAAPDTTAAVDTQKLKLNLTPVQEAPPSPVEGAVAVPPEAPATLPAAAALAAATADEGPTDSGAADKLVGDATEAPVSIIPVNARSSDAPAPPPGDVETGPEIPANVPKTVSPVPIPRAKPEIAAAPAGQYAVQLASIAIEGRAQQEAFRLQKQLGSVLGGREIQIEKAVVAGKGTMYRLRASGYQSQAEARAVCAQAERLKVSCLAIRR